MLCDRGIHDSILCNAILEYMPFTNLKKNYNGPGWEAEAERWWAQGSSRLHSEFKAIRGDRARPSLQRINNKKLLQNSWCVDHITRSHWRLNQVGLCTCTLLFVKWGYCPTAHCSKCPHCQMTHDRVYINFFNIYVIYIDIQTYIHELIYVYMFTKYVAYGKAHKRLYYFYVKS